MMILQLSASVDKIRHILHFQLYIYLCSYWTKGNIEVSFNQRFFTGGKLSEIETLNINYK